MITIKSPATGEVVGEVPEAGASDVDAAVRAARKAFKDWGLRTAVQRESGIRKATAAVRAKAGEIGLLMAREQGKPLNQSRDEVVSSCDLMDFYAAEAPRIEGSINPTEKPEFRSFVTRVPVGVAGLITPWNYPVALLAWKLGPALAAGCAAVVKPTPVTPLSPTAFVKALMEGGLPEGLLSVVNGGAAAGQALVEHPGIDKLAMTGSTATGKALMKGFAPSLRKISLELGGHCPALVLEDADIPATAKLIAYKAFRNMGQSCSSINRVYAHKKIHESLVQALAAEAAKLKIGDGVSDPAVDLGPMTTAEALAKVKLHVSEALAQGARLVWGGKTPEGPAFAKGHYYLPTILTGLKPDMLMAREETFGPVAPFAEFDDVEEALKLANDSPYGLVSYVFTRDMARGLKLAERLEAGTVCLNNVSVNTAYGPYEGWKESGFGVELGRRGIEEYLKIKHIKAAF